jgi:hypothetical protein
LAEEQNTAISLGQQQQALLEQLTKDKKFGI